MDLQKKDPAAFQRFTVRRVVTKGEGAENKTTDIRLMFTPHMWWWDFSLWMMYKFPRLYQLFWGRQVDKCVESVFDMDEEKEFASRLGYLRRLIFS